MSGSVSGWTGLNNALKAIGITELRPMGAINILKWDIIKNADACLSFGDHIAILAAGDVAWHHGLYIETETVMDNCRTDGIKIRSLREFVEGNNADLFVKIEYDSHSAALRRANLFLKCYQETGTPAYHKINFNCETFAMMCCHGRCAPQLTPCYARLLDHARTSAPVSNKCRQFGGPCNPP